MLGFSVTGDDFNGDGRSDIGSARRWQRARARPTRRRVHRSSAPGRRASLASTQLYYDGLHQRPDGPAPHSPFGSRYDGFSPTRTRAWPWPRCRTSTATATTGLAVGSPDTSHAPARRRGNGACSTASPAASTSISPTCGRAGYPYYFHIDFPRSTTSTSARRWRASRDMTGDGWPDLAIGAPQSDLNGKVDSGSVWIINGRLPPATGCRRPTVDATCPWIRIDRLSAAQGYRIDGAAAGDGLGSSLANVGDHERRRPSRPRDRCVVGVALRPLGCRGGRGHARVRRVRDEHLAASPRCSASPGPAAGAGSARRSRARAMSTATAARICSPARRERPPTRAPRTSCAALRARLPISPRRDFRRASPRRERAPRRAAPSPPARAERSSPRPGRTTAAAARSASPAAAGPLQAPVAPAGHPPRRLRRHPRPRSPAAKKPKPKKLCPLKKPKPKYQIVKGKRVKVKPTPCRPRHKAKAKRRRSSGQAGQGGRSPAPTAA